MAELQATEIQRQLEALEIEAAERLASDLEQLLSSNAPALPHEKVLEHYELLIRAALKRIDLDRRRGRTPDMTTLRRLIGKLEHAQEE